MWKLLSDMIKYSLTSHRIFCHISNNGIVELLKGE